jgi:hypothetical protein
MKRHGSRKEHVEDYLNEYLFKEANRRENAVNEFLVEVSKLYPPRV